MSETLPDHTLASFIAGDSVKWTVRTVVNGDHKDPADSWVLSYDLRSSTATVDFSGSDNGNGTHLISLAPAETADYPEGTYFFQASITDGTDRYVVENGQICIEPNFASLGAHDAREWASKVLDALEAMLLNKASNDQQAYSIAGRSLSRMSWGELMEARSKLQQEVRSLEQAEAISKGRGNSAIIRTRI